MALKVGITGGIGSGKSLVCSVFSMLGAPIYNADARAKELMHSNDKIREGVIDNFGKKAFHPDGTIDNKYLANIVFNNPQKLKILNSIIHPVVVADSRQWFEEQTAKYAIKEAALLYEVGAEKYLDFIIVVYAPIKLRLKRVHKRDRQSYREIRRRMENQMQDRIKVKKADFVIRNDGKHSILAQSLSIHHKLLELNV